MNKFTEFRYKKVAIITGGTAGHVMPASDLAHYCSNATVYVNEHGSRFCLAKNKVVYHLENKSIFNMVAQFIFFLWKLRKYEVVIGFGAFMCLPSLLAAKLLGKEVYTHEQNSITGQANKLLNLIGVKVLDTFHRKNPEDKFSSDIGEVVGMPIKNISKTYEVEDIVLILAGSGGSEFFDKNIFEKMNEWAKNNRKYKIYFQTTHPSEYMTTSAYFYNWNELVQKAKLIIARSGANTIAQLTMLKKKGLLIPLSTARQNHQLYNAKKSGMCYIEEKDIHMLIVKMEELLNDNSEPNYNMVLFPIEE